MFFYYLCTVFLGGVGIGLKLPPNKVFILATIILIPLVIVWILNYGSKLMLASVGLLVFGMCYGNSYMIFHHPDPYLSSKVGEKVQLEGVVLDEPIAKAKFTQVIVTTKHGEVLLFANSFPHVDYGDKISFKAKLKTPENFAGDSGRIFNYKGYLSKDGIYFTESYPQIEVISKNNGNYIKSKLYELKNFIVKGMERVVPYPESALLEGITVAGKRALPEEINDEFKTAGVSHIVVLSGYNVTIVALVIMSMLRKLPRSISFGAGTLGIIGFCLLAGGTSTIVRAGVMSFLFILSKYTRRNADPNRLLFIAGALMIIQNPLIMFYDTSFHLSFLATFGLINVSPLIDEIMNYFINKKISPSREKSILREVIVSSIGVEIFLIPYLSYSFGTLSTIALISNILLLVFIPVTMLLGFVSSIFSFISMYIAKVPAFISYIFLRYELRIVHQMSAIPHALIKITVPTWVPAIFYSLSLVVFIVRQIFLERQANLDSQKILQCISSSQTVDSQA